MQIIRVLSGFIGGGVICNAKSLRMIWVIGKKNIPL